MLTDPYRDTPAKKSIDLNSAAISICLGSGTNLDLTIKSFGIVPKFVDYTLLKFAAYRILGGQPGVIGRNDGRLRRAFGMAHWRRESLLGWL